MCTIPNWIYGISTINSIRELERNKNDLQLDIKSEPPLTNQELDLIESIGMCPIIQIPYMLAFGLGLAVGIINKLQNDLSKKGKLK